jgi:hypothetical protein
MKGVEQRGDIVGEVAITAEEDRGALSEGGTPDDIPGEVVRAVGAERLRAKGSLSSKW